MTRYFIDTAYLIALLVESDKDHESALQLEKRLSGATFVTTHMVLAEFLNHFCEHGRFWRKVSMQFVRTIENDPRTEIVRISDTLFNKATGFYDRRPDKGYSLTDACSMVVMRERKITTALTTDHHFTQEGFRAMMSA